MPDYSKGKIYTIRFTDNIEVVYIGSTIQPLTVRFGGHKRTKHSSVYQYIQDNYNGEWNNCYIELYEDFICDSKEQLNKKEGEIIRIFKNENYIVLNKMIAGRTYKEYCREEHEKLNEYRKLNVERKKEYDKEYRKLNAEKIQERKREYNKKNAEKIKAYNQEQYKARKKLSNQ